MPKVAQDLADRRRMYVQSVVLRMVAGHRGLEGVSFLDEDTLCRAQRGQVTRLEYLG